MAKKKVIKRKTSTKPTSKRSARKKTVTKKTVKSTKPQGKQRLQKVLAAAGIDSRRNCEELILDGAVRVNRDIVDELPAFVDPQKDVITVNGKRIKFADKVYFLLNKPKGVICTNSDPQGRKKAIDLIDCDQRIFCVGRLDIDTIGAIVLTNDSELTNRLTHPKFELSKTYEVKLKGRIDGDAIEKLKKGVWLSEGKTEKSAVKVIRRSHTESVLQIVIRQGLNRQVRRIMARVGFKVKSLKRTMIGNINIKGMRIGQYKKLTISQVNYLKKITSK
ncbi:MAG: rRNA pseudouridine synthase [Planctomycetes bacterium]|nr:rRNA pseudouridine synthase [Planctomycetota bacterium]